MTYRTLFFILLLFFLPACSGNTAEQPDITRLPTAVPPAGDGAGIGSWAVSFTYEFPEAFWPAGVHRYAYNVQCPPEITAVQLSGEWRQFLVSPDTVISSEPVYLRLNGFSVDPFMPIYLPDDSINPMQDTTAMVTLLGLSEEAAEQAGEACTVMIAWDNFQPQQLTALEPHKP